MQLPYTAHQLAAYFFGETISVRLPCWYPKLAKSGLGTHDRVKEKIYSADNLNFPLRLGGFACLIIAGSRE